MIRSVYWSFVFHLAVATSAFSEPLDVQSGEHPDFTRLVIDLPDGQSWQVLDEKYSATILVDQHIDGFDISNVFDTIPRTRLEQISSDRSELSILKNCACDIRYYFEQNRYLIVDLLDGAPKSLQTENSQDLTIQLPAENNARNPETSKKTVYTPDSNFAYGDLFWKSVDSKNTQNETALLDPGTRTVPDDNKPIDEKHHVLKTQEELLRAFSRAASLGVLNIETNTTPVQVPNEEKPKDVVDTEQQDETAQSTEQNIRVFSSRDPIDEILDQPNSNLSLEGRNCPDPRLVDIPSWGGTGDFATELGKSNKALYSETGKLNDTEALSRVRLFIFFGFGSEALQTMAMVPKIAIDYPELNDLATIMEHGYARNPRSVHLYTDCPSDFALWGVLSSERGEQSTSVDVQAALRAAERLPAHLRRFLGEKLSRQLIDIGENDSAEVALRSSNRSLSSNATQAGLTEARLLVSEGQLDDAVSILEGTVAENNEDSPIALIEQIENLVRNNRPVSAELALTAEAFSFQYRDSDIANKLKRVSILAASSSGQFGKAVEAMAKYDGKLDNGSEMSVVDHFFRELVDTQNDLSFLEFTLVSDTSRIDEASDEITKLVAKRLLELGFANEAQDYIDKLRDVEGDEEFALLSARVSLDQGQASAALEVIGNYNSAPANELRGTAHQMLSDNEAASLAFERADAVEDARNSRWLTNNWQQDIPSSDPTFGAASDIANEDVSRINVDNQMIEGINRAVISSEQTRQTFSALLNELQLSD